MHRVKSILLAGAAGLLALAAAAADNFEVVGLKIDHANGIYKKGEEIVVTGTLLRNGQPAPEYKLRAVTKWENKVIATPTFPCDGKPFTVKYKSDQPGWAYFYFQVIGPDGKPVSEPVQKPIQRIKKTVAAEIGAMVAPEELTYPQERPADFDEFWQNELDKLAKVPLKPTVTKIDCNVKGIDLYTVSVPAGVDMPVTGYLAIPTGAKAKSLPAYQTFLSGWVGDANRNEAINVARQGAIALITTWHGWEVNHQPRQWYLDHVKTDLRKGADDRETFYYRNMYVRALRAAQFLQSRPEWNGRDYIVNGGSLAGSQAAIVAAYIPGVTIACIHTPSLCGYSSDLIPGRKRSLPFCNWKDALVTPAVRAAAAYHDVVHMAARIKCEVYFTTAFADEVCTPSNVFTAFNNLPKENTKKFMTTNPRTGHYGTTPDVRGNKRRADFFRSYKRKYLSK